MRIWDIWDQPVGIQETQWRMCRGRVSGSNEGGWTERSHLLLNGIWSVHMWPSPKLDEPSLSSSLIRRFLIESFLNHLSAISLYPACGSAVRTGCQHLGGQVGLHFVPGTRVSPRVQAPLAGGINGWRFWTQQYVSQKAATGGDGHEWVVAPLGKCI